MNRLPPESLLRETKHNISASRACLPSLRLEEPDPHLSVSLSPACCPPEANTAPGAVLVLLVRGKVGELRPPTILYKRKLTCSLGEKQLPVCLSVFKSPAFDDLW